MYMQIHYTHARTHILIHMHTLTQCTHTIVINYFVKPL